LKNSTASEYFPDPRLALPFSKELAEAKAKGVGGASGVVSVATRSATVVGWLTDVDEAAALGFGSGGRANS
jgi:hypothetical protein